jgi:putative ABC transport system ATP-binding protein
MSELVIAAQDIRKVYRLEGGLEVHALRGLDLEIRRGQYVAIMGPSGSGKSTLLQILGCLDVPSSGSYKLAGQEVSELSEDDLSAIRNQRIGFIFQAYNLLPRANALHNVALPLMYRGTPTKARIERAREALARVGLENRLDHRPNQLSGGQKQRVAIARALATDPDILLADEPTGNLDSKTGEEILGLFQELHQEGRTIIMVTHEQDVAEHCEEIVRVRDGKVEVIESVTSRRNAVFTGAIA